MVGDDHAFLTSKVLSVSDVEGREIDEDDYASSIEGKEDPSLFDVWDRSRVKAKDDGLSSSQEASIYTLPDVCYQHMIHPDQQIWVSHLQHSWRLW